MNTLCFSFLIISILILCILLALFIVNNTEEKYTNDGPNFLIIGAPKSGTTNLRHLFKLHDEIYTYPQELHYFNSNDTNDSEYRKKFKTNRKLIGEKTPFYFYINRAMSRIYDFNPKMKLILLLRNPILRTYSQWNHYQQECPADTRSFKECVLDNLKNKEIKKKKECKSKKVININKMVTTSKYINHINYILSLFPKEQLYIGITERFKKNTKDEFNKILKFLDAKTDYTFKIDSDVHSRSYDQKISQKDYDFLYKLYKPYNERLYAFLGYRIPEWEK